MAEEKGISKIVKTTIDLIAVILIGYPIIFCPLWCHFDARCTNQGQPGKAPFEIILLILDIGPAVLGAVWLVLRYLVYKGNLKIEGGSIIKDTLCQRLLVMALTMALAIGIYLYNLILK